MITRQQVAYALFTLFILLRVPAAGQAPVTLSGAVTDTTGGALVGASVTAIDDDERSLTTVAGADGRFRLDLPSAGRYRVVVGHDGFAERTLRVTATGDTTRDVELTIAPLDDTIVVTPSGWSERRATTTESVTVFTAEDIQRTGAASLAEVVTRVPGLHVESTGREGALATVFVRGGESDYNRVLVDGVRVNASGGQFDFGRISTGDIDRVEVVRGAQSALYGSDAIGSIVQVFTKRGSVTERPQLAGSFEGGSFGTTRGEASLRGGAARRLDYHVGLAYRGTDGAFSDELPEPDRFDSTSVTGTVGARLGRGARIRTGARYGSARGRSVGQIGYVPGDRGTREDTEDLSWYVRMDQTLTPRVHHSGTINEYRGDRLSADAVADPSSDVLAVLAGEPGAMFPDSPRLVRLLAPSAFDALAANPAALPTGQFLATTPFGVGDFPGTFESELRRRSVRYQIDVTWLDDQVLSAGYEYERESDPLQDYRIDDHAYFVQQKLSFWRHWYATVGGRVDDHSHYGTELSPKLTAGGYPVPFREGRLSSVKLFGSVGKGIKNPAFSELFGSAFVDGNPDLRPERAQTVDAGVEVTLGDQHWLGRVTVFDNAYDEQVAFQFSPGFGGDGIPDFLNIAGADARGVELEGGLQRPIGGLTAHATYAWVDTEVVATTSLSEQFQPGQPLLRRPRHAATLLVTYTRGRASLHAVTRMVGRRHDSSFLGLARFSDGRPVEITVNPGYTVVGLGGQLRVDDGVTVFVRLDNVTDTVYEHALGYPGRPRSLTVGGRVTLGR